VDTLEFGRRYPRVTLNLSEEAGTLVNSIFHGGAARRERAIVHAPGENKKTGRVFERVRLFKFSCERSLLLFGRFLLLNRRAAGGDRRVGLGLLLGRSSRGDDGGFIFRGRIDRGFLVFAGEAQRSDDGGKQIGFHRFLSWVHKPQELFATRALDTHNPHSATCPTAEPTDGGAADGISCPSRKKKTPGTPASLLL